MGRPHGPSPWTVIMDRHHEPSPWTVTMDFEKAVMNAVQEAFGEVEIHGCFYHLAQIIYRKIQANGL